MTPEFSLRHFNDTNSTVVVHSLFTWALSIHAVVLSGALVLLCPANVCWLTSKCESVSSHYLTVVSALKPIIYFLFPSQTSVVQFHLNHVYLLTLPTLPTLYTQESFRMPSYSVYCGQLFNLVVELAKSHLKWLPIRQGERWCSIWSCVLNTNHQSICILHGIVWLDEICQLLCYYLCNNVEASPLLFKK